MHLRTRFTAIGLALVVATSACAGGTDEASVSTGGDGTADGAPQPVADAADVAETADEAAARDAATAAGDTDAGTAVTGEEGGGEATDASILGVTAPVGRKVVFKASLSLEVDDTAAAVADIRQAVEAAGGFVAAAELHRTGRDDLLAGTMTLRVPAGDLTTTLTTLKGFAERVVDESIDSDDVTEEYADVEAQLRNLRALEVELLSLLAEVRDRSDNAEQILAVFQRVREVRGEIERLEGRRQVLDDLVALSTIRVSLTPTPSSAPIAAGDDWRPGEVVRGSLRATVGALQVVANAAIWLVLTGLPILIVGLGLPLAGAFAARHAWRRRRLSERTTSGS